MTGLNPTEISELIKDRIESFVPSAEIGTQGTIINVKDGIINLYGATEVLFGEKLLLPGDVYGMALNLEQDSVGAIVLGPYEHLSEGQTVKCTGQVLDVPVGEALLGRVVDALGNPIDGK